MTEARFIDYSFRELAPEETLERARSFHADMQRRRSIREFAD